MSRFRARPSLRRRFVLLWALVLVAPLLGITALGLSLVENRTRASVEDSLQVVSSLARYHTEAFLRDSLQDMLYAAQYIAEEQHADAESVLRIFLQNNPEFDRFSLIDAQGLLQVVVDGPDISADLLPPIGFDYSNWPLFRQVVHQQRPIWSAVFLSPFSDNISVSMAVMVGSRVLVGDLNLRELDRTIAQISRGSRDIQAMILDSDGVLIAAPDYPALVAQRFNASRIAGIRSRMQSDPAGPGSPLQQMQTLGGAPAIGYRLPIEPAGWSIFVLLPKQSAFAVVRDTQWILAASLSLVGVLALIFLVRTLSTVLQPVARLSTQASQIANGNYQIEIAASPYAETDRLANSMRTMVNAVARREQQLREINQNLEQRIAEAREWQRVQDAHLHEQARRNALANLLINIAHQWRQPLNVISLGVQEIEEICRENQVPMSEIEELIEHCMQQLDELSAIIGEFTDLNQKTTNPRQHFALEKAIDQTLRILGTWLQQDGRLDVDVQIDPVNSRIWGNEALTVEILLALIRNTKEAMQQRGLESASMLVAHEYWHDRGEHRISIRDDAGGIPPQILERIFDPYETAQFKRRHRGLGLFIVKNTVEIALEGSIEARNTEHGAEFLLYLPADPRANRMGASEFNSVSSAGSLSSPGGHPDGHQLPERRV